MDDVKVERVDEVLGWPLAVVSGEAKPLIEDEVLGRKLGMADRSIDRLIDRLEAAGSLGRVLRRRVPKPQGGRPEERRYLTRTQALKVVMRSETATADAIQDEIVAVYEAWLDGKQPSSIDPLVAQLFTNQNFISRVLTERVLEQERRIGDAAAQAADAAAKASTAAGRADAALEAATKAHELAQKAVNASGARNLLDALNGVTRPGKATPTPDGVFARHAPSGYLSMRAVARQYGLPREGEGAAFVGRVARALGLFDRAELFADVDVTTGGKIADHPHRLYGPQAVAELDKPLRAAHATMIELGYTVTPGGALRCIGGRRSKGWVLDRMLDDALATLQPQLTLDDVKAS